MFKSLMLKKEKQPNAADYMATKKLKTCIKVQLQFVLY